jgi:hypothetical protein
VGPKMNGVGMPMLKGIGVGIHILPLLCIPG